MSVKNKRYKKRRKGNKFISALVAIILLCTCALIAFTTYSALRPAPEKQKEETDKTVQVSSVESVSEPEFIDTYATIVSTGDIMAHEPQIKGAYISSTGEYDFSDVFKHTAPYFKKADLAVANLEVTFGGNKGRNYSGYPVFNCPDSMADAIKKSGLRLILTANNHSYDTGFDGLIRTQKVLKNNNIEYTGTRTDTKSPTYVIKEINNIKIGIANFTYETDGKLAGRKHLNGILLSEDATNLVNSFSYPKIEEFYKTAGKLVNKMKKQGAEYILFYIHWGNEYKTEPNNWQKNIAQQLSNRGVDMIIGSHPHVIEPVEMVYSEDGQNTTVCLYSTGNAVSNQRQELMDSCPTGHTEDGMLFYFTLAKTKDGVSLDNLDIIPTWVDKFYKGNGYRYTIYPLENVNDGAEKYGLTGASAARSINSYKRTVEIVAKGLTACQREIGCDITFKNKE